MPEIIRVYLKLQVRLIFHKMKNQAYYPNWVPFDLGNMSSDLGLKMKYFIEVKGSFCVNTTLRVTWEFLILVCLKHTGVLCIFQKSSSYFLDFWAIFWGPLTLGFFRNVGGYLKEVPEQAQPLEIKWNPPLDFFKGIGTVYSTQF